MSGGSMTALYLVLGLGLVAGLYYALTQITARQRRLNAELTRLERLAAEVAMNAEAILEQVDERIDRLNQIAAAVEATAAAARAAVEAAAQAPLTATAPVAPGAQAAPEAPAAPAAVESRPTPKKRRTPKEPATSPEPLTAKYQELRSAVFALADEGKEVGEIAQKLGVPRGEVQLILNLRGRKVTA